MAKKEGFIGSGAITDKKPKSFIGKCIHTFKCMFNPGGIDYVRLGLDKI